MAPVDLKGFYAYLLWSREALEGVSEEALERPLVPRKRLKSVKALLLHTAVEDAWLHEERTSSGPPWSSPVSRRWRACPGRYQEAVGRATGAFLQGPVDEDQVVALHDAPEERYPLGDLLWHASLHEARHGAQVALLLRVLGQEPPALDLYFFLKAKGGQGEVL